MLTHLRPVLRSAHITIRSASTSASSASAPASRALGRWALLGASAVGVGALALNANAESRRVWNETNPGADGRLHSYDENLKVNRHKSG